MTGETPTDYARQVGERLRAIRRQQGISLQEVETRSGGEVRASVLGAYERGARTISVTRLRRLAVLYDVPIDELLPRETDLAASRPTKRRRDEDEGSVTLALAQLNALDSPERDVLLRYVGTIQRERNDFNGKVITLRDEDLRALGRFLELDESGMRRRLGELGVRLHVGE